MSLTGAPPSSGTERSATMSAACVAAYSAYSSSSTSITACVKQPSFKYRQPSPTWRRACSCSRNHPSGAGLAPDAGAAPDPRDKPSAPASLARGEGALRVAERKSRPAHRCSSPRGHGSQLWYLPAPESTPILVALTTAPTPTATAAADADAAAAAAVAAAVAAAAVVIAAAARHSAVCATRSDSRVFSSWYRWRWLANVSRQPATRASSLKLASSTSLKSAPLARTNFSTNAGAANISRTSAGRSAAPTFSCRCIPYASVDPQPTSLETSAMSRSSIMGSSSFMSTRL
mmetsp:Transcript_30622/g.76692  ORF Transcript_30622/g.76692 Transcript_30622/m.76692 type:complete len:289 (-) Transcript_30622:821-1687(-)